MTRDDVVFLVLAVLCLTANLFEPALWMMAVKPLPTLWLVWMAYRHTRGKFGLLLTTGVALGTLGDALLAPILKALFVLGAVAFLVGHLFYIAAYLRDNAVQRARLWIVVPLVVPALVLAGFVFQAMSARGESLLFAGVFVYMVVLLTTAVIAFARRNIDWQIPAGMLVFVASDAHIAFNNLMFAQPVTALLLSGMTTYYLAQWLIVRGAIVETRAALSAPVSPSPAPGGNPAR